jgi:membrane associated rhomboid family serine protease
VITLRLESGEETIALEEFEARVRQGQIEPSTKVLFPVLTGEQWVEAGELDVFRRLYAPARIHFARSFSLGRFPIVTMVLVIVQIVLYFGVAGWQRALPPDPLIEAGAKVQPNIVELGETWRLITANLLHRDVLHLFFNMFFLFNVGGAIENIYRAADYALILLVSALATTTLSTAMSTLPSVGASGMVLGLFGCASVFGYKYGDILPARYRRYFGGAALPYALFILYVGLATEDTDNWGHLGGLLGGIAITLFLEPRLLHIGRPRRSAIRAHATAIAAGALIVLTIAFGAIIRLLGPRYHELVDQQSGVGIMYPALWSFGENHVGYPSWGNTLGASIGVRAERRSSKPMRLREIRQSFLDVELQKREQDGDITAVAVLDERPLSVEGGTAIELVISLESKAGPQLTRNVLIERGFYSYKIVLSSPKAWSKAYAPIFDEMIAGVHLLEPEAVQRARTIVNTFPGMSSAHVELAHQLASIGLVKLAAQAYQRALQALPEQADALYGLAKLAADYEGDVEDAEKIALSLHEHRPEEPSYSALLADLQLRLGQVDGACAVLQETLDLVSDPPEDLRERLRTLKCRADGVGSR